MKRNRSRGEAKGGRVNGEFVDPRNLPALPALVRVRDDEGSIFRWVIGYERSVSGTRSTATSALVSTTSPIGWPAAGRTR